jgi:hypothetical protein
MWELSIDILCDLDVFICIFRFKRMPFLFLLCGNGKTHSGNRFFTRCLPDLSQHSAVLQLLILLYKRECLFGWWTHTEAAQSVFLNLEGVPDYEPVNWFVFPLNTSYRVQKVFDICAEVKMRGAHVSSWHGTHTDNYEYTSYFISSLCIMFPVKVNLSL